MSVYVFIGVKGKVWMDNTRLSQLVYKVAGEESVKRRIGGERYKKNWREKDIRKI